jgi:diguanylate cyclase (GGDEF)-like protein
MQTLVEQVMDARLRDLLGRWADCGADDLAEPLPLLSGHADHLLVIAFDGAKCRYDHYGRTFVEHFGADLTGRVIDVLPTDILPADRRGMLEFEYTFVRRTRRPLWRSYTAVFGQAGESGGQSQTWQRLVLPVGQERLVVGAYRQTDGAVAGEGAPGVDLLRLLIERVPVVVDGRGRVEDLALSLQAFSDTQQHLAELEVLATRDALTGVANLRSFHQLAALELDHARRMGRALSLLALDIDHFKRINDGWGHAAGDAALKAFTAACSGALRELDILGRCGGEEFAIVLPNTGVEGALVTAERLRQRVEQIQVPLPGGQVLGFTVSIGVAATGPGDWPATAPAIADLLAAADKALYRAKADGRNRVAIAETLTPPAG